MRTLPTNAQLLLIVTWCAALLAGAWAALTPPPAVAAHGWEVGLYLGLTILAYDRKIRLVGASEGQTGSLSLGFAITFAALLRFGPHGALVVGTLGCLVSCLRTRRQTAVQLAFNAAVAALSSWLAGVTFVALNGGGLALEIERSAPAVAGASLIYFGLNTGATSAVIALCTRQSVGAFWRENFLWTAPSYFAGACVGTGAALLTGSRSWLMPLLVTPVAWLTYQAYAVAANKARERQEEVARLADLYLGTIRGLAVAIDAKDQHSHRHVLRVQRLAVATARKLGLPPDLCEAVNTGALLHDIGKLGVPDYVLRKPGKLTDEEFAKLRQHPEIGTAILEGVPFPWPVLPAVRSHHERWDGSGYPDGLAGEAIPLTARILAVADVYDALTSSRAYRGAWTGPSALVELKSQAGTLFDPAVVDAFAAILEETEQAEAEEVARAEAEEVARADAGRGAEGPQEGHGLVRAGDAVRQIQRASSELWALYEVAQTLSSSLGLDETLDILGRKLAALLPGTACLFLLREGDGNVLRARTSVGVGAAAFMDAHTAGPHSRSLRVAADRHSHRGAFEPDDLHVPGEDGQAATPHSALIVPIIHSGGTLGTINLYHPEADAFGPHDQQLLETIAERAALALHNGLLFDQTRSHANTDPLTGLFNFRCFTQKTDALCAGPGAEPLALLCLDLDRFKPINDTFGHQAGDRVLCELAELFCGTVRDADIVARYGGDEFLIILRGAGMAEAEAMARRLTEAVDAYNPDLASLPQPQAALDHPRLDHPRLGVSVGAACFPADGATCAALLAVADARMYGDKEARRRSAPDQRDYAAPPLRRAA